ncbi:hypothetical protein MUK42_22213 [Musa troglodytarum]|uniref:Uncharacterized protein n=1 Tax=Musa troglodytarum TaxID=320322 RepID=A0A9E7GEU2_9LILI|nr:hypothetical protein MUK42_22213 [Musa troglodytarum]
MHVFEVSLGAVVCRLYSLSASAWTCLALVAAAATALGLWAVRVARSKFIHPPTSPVPELGSALVVNSAAAEAAIIAKARFTAYYSAAADDAHDDDVDEEDEGEEDEDEAVSNVGLRVRAPRDGGWGVEWTTVMTRGDQGWYRYQDMTALNGSVVKLWDARHGELTSPHGGCLRRRSAGGVEQELEKGRY